MELNLAQTLALQTVQTVCIVKDFSLGDPIVEEIR